MDHKENIHLEIAKFLLNNREVAKMLATAIDTALESTDAYIQREIDRYIEVTKPNHQTGLEVGLLMLKKYWRSKYYRDISKSAGVDEYNPHGCEGEQVYKFIQNFTSTTCNFQDNYTQAEFNALTNESNEDYYTEKAYHEFTASGGCRD